MPQRYASTLCHSVIHLLQLTVLVISLLILTTEGCKFKSHKVPYTMPQHCAILTVLVISLFTIFTTGMLSFQIPEWSIPCAPEQSTCSRKLSLLKNCSTVFTTIQHSPALRRKLVGQGWATLVQGVYSSAMFSFIPNKTLLPIIVKQLWRYRLQYLFTISSQRSLQDQSCPFLLYCR